MMTRRLGILTTFATLGATLAVTPMAANADSLFDDDIGPYAGVGIGYGTFEDEDFLTEDNDLREDRMTWQAYLGANFTDWFGLEVGYVDFGEIDDDGGFLDANGVTAAVSFHIPVHESVSLSLRGGQMWWDSTGTAVAPLDEFEFDADGEDPFYGVGAHFGSGEGVGVNVRYDRYEMGETDIDIPSVNLEFGF